MEDDAAPAPADVEEPMLEEPMPAAGAEEAPVEEAPAPVDEAAPAEVKQEEAEPVEQAAAVEEGAAAPDAEMDEVHGDHTAAPSDPLPPPPADDSVPTGDEIKQEEEAPAPVEVKQEQEGGGAEGEGADVKVEEVLPPPPARRVRWGPPMNKPKEEPAPEAAPAAEGEGAEGEGEKKKRKRKSRWEDTSSKAIVVAPVYNNSIVVANFPKAVTLSNGLEIILPSNVTGEIGLLDPRVRTMRDELEELNRKLAVNELDIPPEGQRSPSPGPVYDRMGTRINTREIRAREKLVDSRHKLIEDLIKEDPSFRPPTDYKARKFTNKIFIPIKQYPTYNFIGLIIGPRGNTQKMMQKETDTKIAIRGRGSVKEGVNRNPSYDYGEDEELHVLITGDTKEDVEKASEMINNLLRPLDETQNEHKKKQLRELALINGTLKEETSCFICGAENHRSEHCPKKSMEVYQLPSEIQAKVNEQYERDVLRMGGSTAGMESEYKSFLKELGGATPDAMMGGGSFGARPGGPAGGPPGPGEDLKLFVGSLPLSFSDAQLRAIFEPFGAITHASVMIDSGTGQSRGFGFVHFAEAEAAAAAKSGMNNKSVDGRPLHVRLKSEPVGGPRAAVPGLGFNPGFGGGGGGGFGSAPPGAIDDKKLYAGFLPNSMSEEELRQLFEQHGQVTDVRIVTDKLTGASKGFGFVSMGSAHDAQSARRALDGVPLNGGRPIRVMVAGTKPSDHGGPPPPRFGGGGMGGPPARPHGGPPGPYGGPPGGGYGAGGYGAGGYGAGGYGGSGYGAPPPAHGGYGAPPPPGVGGYGAPPPPGVGGYGAPPPPGVGGYGAPPPPGVGGYGAPPPPGVGGYGAPPPPGVGSYGAPPPPGGGGGYGPPPPGIGGGGYGGGDPSGGGYGASGGYGAPPPPQAHAPPGGGYGGGDPSGAPAAYGGEAASAPPAAYGGGYGGGYVPPPVSSSQPPPLPGAPAYGGGYGGGDPGAYGGGYGGAPQHGGYDPNPPLPPGSEAAPLPPGDDGYGAPPPPPGAAGVQSDYDRFMAEMNKQMGG